jgi:3-dehydroquinate dehydratase-1
MSIAIIRGPDASMMRCSRDPLSRSIHPEVITALVDSAACAGRTLAIRACGSAAELLAALEMVRRQQPEVLLVDPGTALDDVRVRAALRGIEVPFIEIHDDGPAAEEGELDEAPRNRIGVVHGYMARSYTVAMSKALEHLGCSECEADYHVGT